MNIEHVEEIYFAIGLMIVGVLLCLVGTAMRDGCVKKEDK